ncbi:hypothetical protein KAR48_06405 [bacterium]|nr:hypothetical protein [bacterium]
MTITQDMIETGRQCTLILDDEALQSITDYIYSQWDIHGGFHGRDGRPDLYYTLFGAECLDILKQDLPEGFSDYLDKFGNGEDLDLIHLSCLGRCLALAEKEEDSQQQQRKQGITKNLLEINKNNDATVYGAFVTRLALEEMEQIIDDTGVWNNDLEKLRTADGGYAEQGLGDEGTTPVTAAAAVLKSEIDSSDSALIDWLLLRRSWMGGFHATPAAPVPDLLSTATALFALKRLGHNLTELCESSMMFIESLWHENGGFVGHMAEPNPDCEYTFYGLLALGILAPLSTGQANEPES